MTEKDLFLRSVQLDWSKIPENSYLREIPALQDLSEIMFHQPVTFFVGENGNFAGYIPVCKTGRICGHYWP